MKTRPAALPGLRLELGPDSVRMCDAGAAGGADAVRPVPVQRLANGRCDWAGALAAALDTAAQGSLAGRDVLVALDDRLVHVGLLHGPLWRLSPQQLQLAAADWAMRTLGEDAGTCARAVLQRDGMHALVAVVERALVDAVAGAIAAAGGRLQGMRPQWMQALACAEREAGADVLVVSLQGARAVLARRHARAWVGVATEDLDDPLDWPHAAEAFLLRTGAAPSGLQRWVAGAASAPSPWRRLACQAPLARSGRAAASCLDFSDRPAAAARGERWLALAGGLCLAGALAGLLQQAWLLQQLDDAVALRPVRPLPVVRPQPAALAPPVATEVLEGVAAELRRSWLPALDDLATLVGEPVQLLSIEPQLRDSAGPLLRITAQAASAAAMVEWVRRIEDAPGFAAARLRAWQPVAPGGQGVRFDVEALTDAP